MLTMENTMFTAKLLEEIRDHFMYVDSDPFSGRRIYLEASGGSLRLNPLSNGLLRKLLYRMSYIVTILHPIMWSNPSRKVLKMLTLSWCKVRIHYACKQRYPSDLSAIDAITSHVPGTNIVTTELEHPAVFESTRQFAEKTGKEWRVAKLDKKYSRVPMEGILTLVDKDNVSSSSSMVPTELERSIMPKL